MPEHLSKSTAHDLVDWICIIVCICIKSVVNQFLAYKSKGFRCTKEQTTFSAIEKSFALLCAMHFLMLLSPIAKTLKPIYQFMSSLHPFSVTMRFTVMYKVLVILLFGQHKQNCTTQWRRERIDKQRCFQFFSRNLKNDA